MKQATIDISKVAVKVQGNAVTQAKLGDLSTLVSGLDVFTLRGTCKQSKVAKYQRIVEEAGYTLAKTNWIDNAGFKDYPEVVNFSLIFVKN